MKKILMSEPNISEGRNLGVIEGMVSAAAAVNGVTVMDYSSDRDHNRSVITLIGEPQAVLAGTIALAEEAYRKIDMRYHSGEHPRQGAVDVCAFIPIRNMSEEEATQIARSFGKHVGSLGIPVYYYESASAIIPRRSLPELRRGEYEALAVKLNDPRWIPDEGPAEFNPKSGALVTGARFPLIAFNANLSTNDVKIAREIARSIRHVSGGFRYVRALGILLHERDMAQVSMNLLDYRKTPIARVLETVRSEAARYGVQVVETEVIGPVSLDALLDVARFYLQAHALQIDQVVENALLEAAE